MAKWRSPHDVATPNQRKKRALLIAIFFCVLAFLVQLVGAFYTGSIALLGDTAHLFTDLFSLIISLVAVILSERPTTKLRSFGLYRLEVLAGFMNGVLLLAVSLFLIWESVERLITPQSLAAGPLLFTALVGFILNLLSAAALWLVMRGEAHQHHHHHGHAHDHDHNHAHDHQHGHHSHHEDRNIRGALLHVLSDALGSLAVMIAAVLIHYTGYVQIDAIIGMVLSVLISYWSIRLMIDTAHVLLESTPKHIKSELLLKDLQELDGAIQKIDDVHVWEITSRMYAATGEIFVHSMSLEQADAIRHKANELLRDRYGIAHAVLAVRKY